MRSQLTIWADDPADAVLWAGGLICDHALGGWEVMVLLPGPSRDRALSILGAKIGNQEGHSRPRDLAVPVLEISAFSDDPDRPPWMTSYTCGPFEPNKHGFRHRLSMGARAFKAHALRAAGLTAEVAAAEIFRSTMPWLLTVSHGRIGRWPNAGQCNDASNTPGACC